jgi:hypothetical protein
MRPGDGDKDVTAAAAPLVKASRDTIGAASRQTAVVMAKLAGVPDPLLAGIRGAAQARHVPARLVRAGSQLFWSAGHHRQR